MSRPLIPIRILPLALLLACANGLAQDDVDDQDEISVAEMEDLDSVVDLGLDDAAMAGNPMKSLFSNWPPDLVVAPVPGYSPQVGWNLAVAAGYFLTPKDEESKVPPSILGAFGFIAENGSIAYGAGVKLNLLDDRLRVTAGGGYADVRYRFYGRDRDQNNLGIGIDILQEGPAFFAKARWRLFGRFYAGVGYLSGTVDTRLSICATDSAMRARRLPAFMRSPARQRSKVRPPTEPSASQASWAPRST